MKTTHAAPSRHYHGTFADFLAPEDIVPLVPLTDEEWNTIRRAVGLAVRRGASVTFSRVDGPHASTLRFATGLTGSR